MISTDTESKPQTDRPVGQPWTVAEAARFLRIGERSLHRYIAAGRVPSIRFGDRRLVADDVVRKLASRGLT
jgi:excisionase family DNA binding protein